MVDFSLTSEQSALRDSLERFTTRDYDWDRRMAIVRSPQGRSPEHWATFAELGWLGAGLAEDIGGFGGGAVENALIAETFGRALVVEPFVAHVVATNILALSEGAEATELLTQTVAGERRIVLAHSEDGPTPKVVESEGAAVSLSGEILAVDGAPACDLLIVSAYDADGGLGFYLVDPTADGVRLKTYRTIDNRRVSDIVFDAAPVLSDLGFSPSAKAADVLERALDWGVAALCAEAVGAMDAALYLTRDYLQTRKQFGMALGGFQALQHAMADLLIETEMARSILFHALAVLEGDDVQVRRRGVSAAKVAIGRAGLAVAARTVQLHGGIGVTEEHRISHFYRRLFCIARLLGTERRHLDRFIAATDIDG